MGKRSSGKTTDVFTNRVVQSPDGKYRWACEVCLLTNLTTFLHATKLLVLGATAVGAMIALFCLTAGATLSTAVGRMTLVMFMGLVLAVVGYIIYVFIRGFRFTVCYTLDEKQLFEQYTPARLTKIPDGKGLKGLIDIISSRPGMPGWGFVYATGKSTSTMPLKRIVSIKPRRALGHIKVSLGLDSLHAYVPAEDFDFVVDFLRSHCPNT